MYGVQEVLCALAGGPVLQNYQSFLTSYKDDSTKLSTLEDSMNFFSPRLLALQQQSKSAFLHRFAPLPFSLVPTADHDSSRIMLSVKQSGIYLLS